MKLKTLKLKFEMWLTTFLGGIEISHTHMTSHFLTGKMI